MGEREKFGPGAFRDLTDADVILAVQHSRSKPIAHTGAAGLSLTDLRMEAQVPETVDAEDALKNVRAKILHGLSVEFLPDNQTTANDGGNLVGAPRFELGTSCSRSKRATSLRHAPTTASV